MVTMKPRRLLTKARRAKIASAIKYYIVVLIAKNNSNMSAVRDKIRQHKGVVKLAPAVCENWAQGLGMQTLNMDLMFTDYDILQFFIKTLGIKVDEQTENRLLTYGVATYTYDLQDVVDFYWKTVGEVLCWC